MGDELSVNASVVGGRQHSFGGEEDAFPVFNANTFQSIVFLV